MGVWQWSFCWGNGFLKESHCRVGASFIQTPMAKNLHNHWDTMRPLSKSAAVWFLRNVGICLPAASRLTNSYYKEIMIALKIHDCFCATPNNHPDEKLCTIDLIKLNKIFPVVAIYISQWVATVCQRFQVSPIIFICLQFNSKNAPRFGKDEGCRLPVYMCSLSTTEPWGRKTGAKSYTACAVTEFCSPQSLVPKK